MESASVVLVVPRHRLRVVEGLREHGPVCCVVVAEEVDRFQRTRVEVVVARLYARIHRLHDRHGLGLCLCLGLGLGLDLGRPVARGHARGHDRGTLVHGVRHRAAVSLVVKVAQRIGCGTPRCRARWTGRALLLLPRSALLSALLRPPSVTVATATAAGSITAPGGRPGVRPRVRRTAAVPDLVQWRTEPHVLLTPSACVLEKKPYTTLDVMEMPQYGSGALAKSTFS